MTRIAIIGSGPAGLMAADRLSANPNSQSMNIQLFEKRKGLGRKLLVAGSSGLNVSNGIPIEEWPKYFEGEFNWSALFSKFGTREWLAQIQGLGFETFLGTSNRHFLKEMKASLFLKAWTTRLEKAGVKIHAGMDFHSFHRNEDAWDVVFMDAGGETKVQAFDRLIFALGGGSWNAEEALGWPKAFIDRGISFTDFTPANAGYEIDWPEAFLKEADRKPLKSLELTTQLGTKAGELMVTSYGIEGTPVYYYGVKGTAYLDLKPGLSVQEVQKKLEATSENFSLPRRLQKLSGLGEAAQALVFHLGLKPAQGKALAQTTADLAALIKKFPLELKGPRPLSESISSRGGIDLSEVGPDLQLKLCPGVYLAGEMLNWSAPTGGFLIQASVAQGVWAADHCIPA